MGLSDRCRGFSHAAADLEDNGSFAPENLFKIERGFSVRHFVKREDFFKGFFLCVADMAAAHGEASDMPRLQFFKLFGGKFIRHLKREIPMKKPTHSKVCRFLIWSGRRESNPRQ